MRPSQIADWLAIAGDSVDSIPGVEGLGEGKAAEILRGYGTLEAALKQEVWSPERADAAERTIADLGKRAKGRHATVKLPAIEPDPMAASERKAVLALRHLDGLLRQLQAGAEAARFSRLLTALDCDAPIDMPWEDLPVGGFQVEALRKKFTSLGFTAKAREVPAFKKPIPWASAA